jgi:hypothetical protein
VVQAGQADGRADGQFHAEQGDQQDEAGLDADVIK